MQIAIALYPGFTALDVVGPYSILSNVPGTTTTLAAVAPGTISDDNGLLHLRVDAALADLTAPDVVLVPGAPVAAVRAAIETPLVDWVRSVHPGTTWTTSVCTGALVLGAAGVLDGLPATTHWLSYEELASYGATPTEQRVVFDGKVATGAGVSAGIDLALALVGRQWGDDLAEALQLAIEYDPQPPYDRGAPSKARQPIVELVTGVLRG